MANAWNEKEVFYKARELSAEERDAYLNEVCPDLASRARIESLLRQHANRGILDEGIDLPMPASTPASIPTKIGEFWIIRMLGEGGMGAVYLAEDTILGRKVALKVLARHLIGSEQALARFREEARSAARLKHPAIVPVFKFDRDGNTHYIASEFVEGPTLAQVIRDRRNDLAENIKTESPQLWHHRAAEIIATIADALDCAHKAQIIHRDIKPSNILMDHQAGPRLTDFGIAKHLTEEDRTVQSGIIGTYNYMSPEQASIAGVRVDEKSDIFSLGVVLYELLSLRRPFDGPTAQQILRAIVEFDPPRLRTLDRNIPKDLETICHAAIEKDPLLRYQTAAHVAAELRCYLSGAPILKTPPGRIRRARRWAMVHRRPLAFATVLGLVGLVAFLAWSIHFMRMESLAWFTLDVPERDCPVYLQSVRPTDLELQEPRLLGRTPLDSQLVPPGSYRLTVVAPHEDAFAEFDFLLVERGRKHSTLLLIGDDWKEDKNGLMRSNAPGQVLRARFLKTDSVIRSGMGSVVSGNYPFGWSEDPSPTIQKRNVFVESCFVDYTEVSNSEYKQFCDATGHSIPFEWTQFGYPSNMPDTPIVGVTWEDAEAYARWVGKRLPTMFEWQAAARGAEGHLYANDGDKPPEDVRQLTLADYFDLTSLDQRVVHDAVQRFAIPVNEGTPDSRGFRHFGSNAKEISGTLDPDSKSVVIMGPCWSDGPQRKDLAKVLNYPVSKWSPVLGFRCAKSAAPSRLTKTMNAKGEANVRLQSRND